MRRHGTVFALTLALAVANSQAVAAASVAATWPVGDQPFGVVVDPTDGRVYVGNEAGTTVSVVDPSSGTVSSIVTGSQPGLLAIDPAARRLYVSNWGDGSIAVVDLTSQSVIATVAGAGGIGVAVDPQTHRLYAARGSELVVVDTVTHEVVARVSAPPQAGWFGVAVDASAHRIYLTNINESAPTLSVLDDGNYSLVADVPLPLPARFALAVDAARQLVYVASFVPVGSPFRPGSFYVLDAATLQITMTTSVGGFPGGIALSPSTHRIYVTDLDKYVLSELDDTSFVVTQTIALPWQAGLAAMHPDGRLYVAGRPSFGADVLAAILLENSAPVVDSVTLSPAAPRTNEVLHATVWARDPEGDAMSFTYQWSRNGTVIGGATGPELDLSTAGAGDRGDTITVQVTATDGQAASAPVSASAVIADTAPSVAVALDKSAPATNAVLVGSATGFDVDGDILSYTFAWKVNGVVRKTTSGPYASDSFDLGVVGNGDHGDTVVVEVVASDGALQSPVGSVSAIIVNSAPTVSVSLSDATPWTNDILVATAVGGDTDNDSLTFTYTWSVNGVLKRTATTAASTDSLDLKVKGNGDNGDLVSVSVTATDGIANSSASASATVTPGRYR